MYILSVNQIGLADSKMSGNNIPTHTETFAFLLLVWLNKLDSLFSSKSLENNLDRPYSSVGSHFDFYAGRGFDSNPGQVFW